MIWLIGFLVVWVLANVFWNYRFYKEQGFLRICDMFQGVFAAVPNLVVSFYEWMDKFRFWNYPLFMSKEMKDDIEFMTNESKFRIQKLASEIQEEINKEIEKGNYSLKRDWEKEEPKKKLKHQNHVIQENIDKMTHEEKKQLKKSLKGKVGKIK